MCGLLRKSEQDELKKAEENLARENKKIQAIKQKESERKAQIDKVETDYANAVQLFNIRCQQRGANAPAIVRLLLLSKHDIRRYTPDEWASLIESFGLTEFASWLNDLCPPETPPKKKVLPTLEDD